MISQNIMAQAKKLFQQEQSKLVFLARVTAVSGRTVKVQPTDSQYPINQFVKVFASYTSPAIGDTVKVSSIGGGYLVEGKVG